MTSLAEAIYTLPTERLRALVQARKVEPKKLALIPDKRQLAQFLANELNRPASVTGAILQCNARELRLLQILTSAEKQVVPWKHVLEMAGDPALSDALKAVLTGLENLGMAFSAGDSVLLAEAARHQVPASLADRYTLSRCLNLYDATSIKRICDRLGLPNSTKTANVEAIRDCLLGAEKGLRLNSPLDEEETAVLEYILQSGGYATAIEVASAALNAGADDFFRYDWQNRWKQGKERNAIDRLLARGLLYVVSYSYGFNLFLLIPGDLMRVLTGAADHGFWTEPPPAPKPLPTPPEVVSRHATLTRDVVALLGFLSTQEAVRTNTGHIHKTSLKNLARNLSLPEDRYAMFLYALCREAGLIATVGEKQVYTLTAKGNSWLTWNTLEQTRALFEAWRKGDLWGEMFTDPLKKAGDYRQADNVLTMRQGALNLLIQGGADSYIEINSLTDALAFRSPLLLVQSSVMGGDLVPSPSHFIRLLIGECLYWLGLVELSSSGLTPPTGSAPAATTKSRLAASALQRGEPSQKAALPDAEAYHLMPLGAYLLGLSGVEAPQEAPQEDKFIVQANAEIFVPPYLEPATLHHLLMLTETPAKGATGNTVTLTRDSIRRALDQGISAREILAFLQGHARTGIPQNVEYLINEVGGKHGHIHLGKAQMYLQVDSPLILKELQARRELKDLFVRILSDTVAILRADDPDKLLRDLRKAGYLPVSDDAPKTNPFQLPKRQAPSGPVIPDPTQAKQQRRSARVDTSLDWERIARDDNRPWNSAAPSVSSVLTKPMNAVMDKMKIRSLLQEAASDVEAVQIAYLGQDGAQAQVRFIEPRRLMGNFVVAYCQDSDQEESLNLNRIFWARLAE